MATNHSLSQGLSPSAGSYISLGNSERPARVTGRRESPFPQRAAASAASGTSRAKAPKPGRKDVPRVAPAEAPLAVPSATKSHRGGAHVAQVEEEPALLLAHASIELSPAASAAAALLHLDEPRAHTHLGDGSSSDKTDGWCLDTGATHHMIDRREFFTELDSDVRGSVKFGDASSVEIKGVGFIFATELDESGSRVEIKDRVMRIWDRLLAKVTRGTNRLYVLNVQVAQPLCLAARWDDEA
jgi:hypothetical protein